MCSWCCWVVRGRNLGFGFARCGHANDKAGFAGNLVGCRTPPRPEGCPCGLLLVVPFVENPDRGASTTVSQPTSAAPKIGRARGRGGAPGRAATTVSATTPKGLNQPSYQPTDKKPTTRSKPPRHTTEENPDNTPTMITHNQPHRRRENQAQHQPPFRHSPKTPHRRRTTNTNHTQTPRLQQPQHNQNARPATPT